jgi:hypothetical protein
MAPGMDDLAGRNAFEGAEQLNPLPRSFVPIVMAARPVFGTQPPPYGPLQKDEK